LDSALGHDRLAARRLQSACRAALDPTQQALAGGAARASILRLQSSQPGRDMRRDALTHLDRGDADSATALAERARAIDPDPVADLLLRHRLSILRGDHHGALGTALLLRQYGADANADSLLARDHQRLGQHELARRAAVRLMLQQWPTADLMAAFEACGDDFARFARIHWTDAVQQVAVPAR
jgi:hypothetical protein